MPDESIRPESKKAEKISPIHEQIQQEIIAELTEIGITIPEAEAGSWEAVSPSEWNAAQLEAFTTYIYSDDKRIVPHELSAILASTATEKPLVDGFPLGKAPSLSPELRQAIAETYPMGIDQYFNGILDLERFKDLAYATEYATNLGITLTKPEEIEYFSRLMGGVGYMMGNTTGNSLARNSEMFLSTVYWAQFLSRAEAMAKNSQETEEKAEANQAIRVISNKLRNNLVELPNSEENIAFEGLSGTHLWYLITYGNIVNQSTEAGRTVKVAATGEPLPLSVSGGKAEDLLKAKREVRDVPVRDENGTPIKYETYKKMHYKYMVDTMQELLEKNDAKAEGDETVLLAFTQSIVVPGKGGVVYKEMDSFIKSLDLATLAESPEIEAEQREVISKYLAKGGKFELVVDCAQGRWKSPAEVIRLMEEAHIEGWVMATTSKAEDGPPFGGYAVGTKGASQRLKTDVVSGEVFDPRQLQEYFGVGFLPADIEAALIEQLKNSGEEGIFGEAATSGEAGTFDLAVHLSTMARMFAALHNTQEAHATENSLVFAKATQFLVDAFQEYAQKDERIRMETTGRDTEYELSSIASFQILDPEGKPYSSDVITKLRSLARIGVDIDITTGEIVTGKHPVQAGNPFGESIYLDSKTDLPVSAKHPAWARLGIGLNAMRLVASSFEKEVTNPDLARKELEMAKRVFVDNMARMSRLAAAWPRLEEAFYKESVSLDVEEA